MPKINGPKINGPKINGQPATIGATYESRSPEIVIGGQRTAQEVPCQHLGALVAAKAFPPAKGFGDYTDNLIHRLGAVLKIDDPKQWVADQVAKLKATPAKEGGVGCGCNWRHKWLNKLSGLFGRKGRGPEVNHLLEQLVQITEVKPRDVFACGVFGQCVVNYRPSDELRVAMVNDLQCGACAGCEKYAARVR